MPSYRLIGVEIAQQQYDTLSDDVRLLVAHRLTQLLGDPTADAVYNRRSDQWSIPPRQPRVPVLRRRARSAPSDRAAAGHRTQLSRVLDLAGR